MNYRLVATTLALWAMTQQPAFAQGNPGAGMSGMGVPAANSPAGNPEITKPLVLTEAQVKGFLDAIDALRLTGSDTSKRLGADPSKPAAFAAGMQLTAETQAILKSNGFADVTEFQRVGYNAALAYGVLKEGGKEAVAKKMAKAKAEQAKAMEQMRQQLGDEQAKVLSAQMGAGFAMAESLQDVPEENVALVTKYADRMANLSKKK